MRGKKWSIGLMRMALAVFTLTLLASRSWAAHREEVLHSFNNENGANPYASVIFGVAGNLYGTTFGGGEYGYGTAFELRPKAGGGWTEKLLHTFNFDGRDGYFPRAGLVIDAAGNLYGATLGGGSYNAGTVFELTPKADGHWTEKLVHSFNINGREGLSVYASLIFDASGNLYGTTVYGGSGSCNDGNGGLGCGVVFELTPNASGLWSEKVLYNFKNNGRDARYPVAGLTFDAVGNLYSTTEAGGTQDFGGLFELTPKAAGGWTEKVLHSFSELGRDGNSPLAGLIVDAAGNLYGTTFGGGAYGWGTVFEMSPGAGGGWKLKVLHTFPPSNGGPSAGLIFDASGNLYSTTNYGGAFGYGTVFEMTANADGGWTAKVLHSFNDNGKQGIEPAGLIIDAAGNLYGTTYLGGADNYGTVFEITP
jgi:uncharacterized repeat protein (TIGR03803 family)